MKSMMQQPRIWDHYNILIIDDETSVLEQIQQDLYAEGFSLITANSAEKALKILKKQEVHVIVCDQKMPGGMSGTHFLSRVRKKWPNIVGLILSAYSEPEYVMSAVNEAQAFKYMLKPWDKQELIQRLVEALEYYQSKESQKQGLKMDRQLSQAYYELDIVMDEIHKSFISLCAVYNRTSEITGDIRKHLNSRLEDAGLPLLSAEDR